MSSIDILREISNENNGLILTKAAAEKGVSRSNLSKLCDNGKITRIVNTTQMGNKVWAYDMDRTICDIVRSRSRMADETFISYIKNYATNPHKNLANLSLYATKMGILSRVRQYLEVLL